MTRDDVLVVVSGVDDGSMSKCVSVEERDKNRFKFLAKQSIGPDQAILVHLTYGGDNYCRYETVNIRDAGDGITRPPSSEHDALFTKEKNIALLLPIADCIGVTLYDPKNHVLGLAHLGRHNLVQQGGTKIVEYMKEQFGVVPKDVLVWFSSAASKEAYPLFDYDGKAMHELAVEQMTSAGILEQNFSIDSRDTTSDPQLFSHSQFLKGQQKIDGRQAMLAMMR